MKRILLFLIAAFVMVAGINTESKAQVSKPLFKVDRDYKLKKDTATNTDTVALFYNNIESGLKSIEIAVKKVSGTVGGKVYVQGSSNNWVSYTNIDSLSCADVSLNSKLTVFASTNFLSYRVYYTTSGTQVCVVYAALLRRPDEY